MGGNRASKRRSAKRLSLARSLDDLEVGIDSLRLKRSIFQRNVWLSEDMYSNSENICDKDFCEHPIVLAIQTIPVSLAPFLTFHFRCLELVLAAITVARGRSQSVLCVGHSCGPVCLASLMSAGAWLKIILTFSRISFAEEPSFSDGLCMRREKRGFIFATKTSWKKTGCFSAVSSGPRRFEH